MTKQEILGSLNEQQQQACTTTEGNIRLIAGAGSGKTNVISKRVAYICKEKGITPDRILCMTFTNKAAKEMKERIASLLDVEQDNLSVSTFHRLALNIVEEDIESTMGWEKAPIIGQMPMRFVVQDFMKSNPLLFEATSEEDKRFLEQSLIRYCESLVQSGTYEMAWLDKNQPLPEMIDLPTLLQYEKEKQEKLELVKSAKSKLTYREKKVKEGKANEADLFEMEELKRIIEENAHEHQENSPTSTYAAHVIRQKTKYGMLTFDELIAVAHYLLKTYPEVQTKWANQYDYVQVDEFQDTDALQLEIVKLLTEENDNLFVVGDSDQSIYGFRGTSSELFIHLEDYLQRPVTTITMTTNYRSTKDVLDIANKVIQLDESRIPKDLTTLSARESRLEVLCSDEEGQYADKVVAKIQKLLQEGTNPEEIAILYRMSSDDVISTIYEKLKANGIVMDTTLDGNSTVNRCLDMVFNMLRYKETLNDSYFHAFVGNLEDAFITTYSDLKSKFEQQIASIDNVLDEMDYLEILQSYIEVKLTKAGVPTGSYKSFLENQELISMRVCSLIQNWATLSNEEKQEMLRPDATPDVQTEEEKHGIKVMTMHKAKGLEFENVFVCGLSNRTKAMINSNESTKNEECRLHYVAYSRAKTNLYLVEENPYEMSLFSEEVKPLFKENDSPELDGDDFEIW